MAETCFAVCSPGLEPLTRLELTALGLLPAGPRKAADELGGVTFSGGRDALYRANLCLHTASRVLVRLGEFYAAAFPELRKKASRLAWENYIVPGLPIAIHATCHKSRLYHSGGVAERIAGAIADRLGREIMVAAPGSGGAEAGDQQDPPQLVIVRLVNDQVTISVDSSGELLHRRGYRLATAKAPLRETLAAAMLLASGWAQPGLSPAAPLLDPFCGSGTIPIEAARMARGIPPGSGRGFAFMRWRGFDPAAWQAVQERSAQPPTGETPPILASDRDAGAARMARENAERAGVAEWISFSQRAVSAVEPPPGPGWVVTNPPYGVRVSAQKDLRNLYAQIGNVLRARCPGWRAAILCSDPRLLGQIGLPLDTRFSMVNGGLRVMLGQGVIPTG